MLIRIIAILLGLLLGTGYFIGEQYIKKQSIITETNKINDKVISEIQNHEIEIKNKIIEEEKNKIAQTFKQDPYIIVYDFFDTYENMYNKILLDKEYFAKITDKTFQDTLENKNLNSIKSNLLVTKIFDGSEKKVINGVPINIECKTIDIKSPCVVNEKASYNIKNIKVVHVNKEFSIEEIKKILNTDVLLFYKASIQ